MYNHIVGVLAILAQIAAVILLVHLIWKPRVLAWIDQFGEHALMLAFFGAVFAIAGSLIYEYVFHYQPCYLCWWQRIFIYPLTPILAIALWKKSKDYFAYPLSLIFICIPIATYHVFFERIGDPLAPCDASGISCAARPVWEFGYIGIPMLSLTALVVIALLIFLHRKYLKTNAGNL